MGARLDPVRARPPLAPTVCLFVPSHRPRRPGNLRAPRGQPLDPGCVHSAHARPASTSRADLRGEPGADPRRPAAARNLEPGAEPQRLPSPKTPAPLRPCTHAHNADARGPALAAAAGRERAPPSRSPSSGAARPPPRRTAQLRESAGRNRGLRGARRRSSCPRPRRPVPTPTVPSSRRAGARRGEGSYPAPPEQSPPRELAAAHRAGDKGGPAAPSSTARLRRRRRRRREGGL